MVKTGPQSKVASMPRIAGCFDGENCASLGDVPELWIGEDTRLILRPTYSMTRKSLLRLRHEILNFGRQSERRVKLALIWLSIGSVCDLNVTLLTLP